MDTGDGTLELFVSRGSTPLVQTFIEGLIVDGTCPGHNAGLKRPTAGADAASEPLSTTIGSIRDSVGHSVWHADFAWSICGPDAGIFRHSPGRTRVISARCVAYGARKSESQPANT